MSTLGRGLLLNDFRRKYKYGMIYGLKREFCCLYGGGQLEENFHLDSVSVRT